METETTIENTKNNECTCKCNKYKNASHGGEAVYGLGFIGACIYFISHAATFWLGVLGFLKAIVWPAFVVYKFLEFFHL